MRLFITGASGFVGAATLSAALVAGHEVAALVRPGSEALRLRPFEGRYRRLPHDLRETADVAAGLAAFRPDAVLHLAWWGVSNTVRFEQRQVTENIATSCTLADAAAAAGARAFVGIGSQAEYGPGSSMREEATPEPTSLYGAAKAAAMILTRQIAGHAGMRHVWLRLFSTYGPNDNPGWLIPGVITDMLAGRRPRTTPGTQSWDWLHVDDVAQAIVAAAATPEAAGIFNLGSGQPVPIRSAIERIRDLAAPGMKLVFGEIPYRPDQVMFMRADISRISAVTGWTPRITLDEGLAATVAWYRDARDAPGMTPDDWLGSGAAV